MIFLGWEIDNHPTLAGLFDRGSSIVRALTSEAHRGCQTWHRNIDQAMVGWLTESLVVSARFCECYRSSGLSGIREYLPIEVVKIGNKTSIKNTEALYYCAEVDYTENVKIDHLKSEVYGQKYDWSCELCNPQGEACDRVDRLVLKEFGPVADIFKVYGHGIVVTERFYKFVRDCNFTNFNLVPIEDYHR